MRANAKVLDIYPLSPSQRGMLFHTLYAPESGVYVVQYRCLFEGPLHGPSLEHAWNHVVRRHDILRTGFVWEEIDKPVQVVYEEMPVTLETLDWTGQSPEEQQEALRNYLNKGRSKGFDLGVPPLMRFTLIRLDEERHQFVWSFHHILLDGWSIAIVMGDMFAYYDAVMKGENLRLPALRPYRDYIAWNQKQDLQEAKGFWRGMLQGIEAPTPLPFSRVSTGSGYEEIGLAVPVGVSAALQQLARKHQITLNTIVQGAWAVLLSRYSRERDVVYGSVASGRPANLPGVESMVGLFINTLPVRVHVDPELTVGDYLTRLQELQADIRQYEYCPLTDVQGWSEMARGTSLFDSIVVFENYPVSQPEDGADGLFRMIGGIESEEQTNYPVTVSVIPGEAIEFSISFDRSKFERDVILQMLGNLQTLLEAMGEHPDSTLAALPTLTEAERCQVLEVSQGVQADYGDRFCVHEWISQQVEKAPELTAVEIDGQTLSYRELESEANRLAHYLRKRGVGPEVSVGLCIDRSLELAVALLGVLKAGGVYIPLDPDYPKERLAFMIEDANMAFLLSKRELADELPQHTASVVLLDEEWEEIAEEPEYTLDSGVTLDHAAYVIYTSGSTGTPKGVVITHRSLLNHNRSVADSFELSAQDRVLQFATINFDAAVEEFFPTWLCGGALVMTAERLMSPAEFNRLIEEHDITVLNLPTAYWHEWVFELSNGALGLPTSIRAVIIGGERPSPERFAQWQRVAGHRVAWYNTYGPTEATVSCTVFQAPQTEAEGAEGPVYAEVPIGRPVANAQVYILDERLEPVPIGVPGELYIGGAGLARGYLNRPELTEERFVPNPFAPGERLYRTGDLGRYLPDGHIEFLGRTDYQVKIRGFRIELEEIEAVLSRHPQVRDTVVVAREDRPGEKRLVAYVVPEGNQPAQESELRAYLVEQLPAYMVPAAVVSLAELPLTPSGKIDRKALPAPDWSQLDNGDGYAAPRSATEEALCRIWSDVLGVGRVGVHDNFFELGGDSILSIQVVSRAAQEGIGLTPKHIFEARTIAELAPKVKSSSTQAQEQGAVTGDVPMTPIQSWFFEQDVVDRFHWNQVSFLEVRQPVDTGALEKAAGLLWEHHDALRMQFRQDGESGVWTQSNAGLEQVEAVESAASRIFQRIDLSGVPAAERKQAIEAAAVEVQRSVSLSGPLARVALLDLGPDEPARLLFVVHHLVVDGVSWRILLEDLQGAYEALLQDKPVRFAPKTTSFQTWSRAVAQYTESEALRSELSFWAEAAGVQPLALPTDLASTASLANSDTDMSHLLGNVEGSADIVTAELDEEETHLLLREVPVAYRTQINDALLTALVRTITRWTGGETLAVDLEGHGREEDIAPGTDLSRTVGWFTSVYPVQFDLRGASDAGQALVRVKELLAAIPNRGVGYGLLRYASGAEAAAALAQVPQAEISFNYLGQMNQTRHGKPDKPALFTPAKEDAGAVLHPANKRPYLLDINALVSEGKLRVSWTYSRNVHQATTIDRLARWYVEELRALIAHCLSSASGGFSLSDFPLAKLTQRQLDEQLGVGRQIEDIYPLSPMQEGMFFHSVYTPGAQMYFEQSSFTLEGPLHVEAFERAWRTVVQRHSILRSAYIWEGVDQPHQIVRREVKLPFEQWDWTQTGNEEQEGRWEEFLKADRQRSFDLTQAPLMRISLVKWRDDLYKCVWSFHHILLDGWSVPSLLSEVFELYHADVEGREAELPSVRPYRDYIAWLGEQDLSAAEMYWREQLAGFTSPTSLGIERRIPEREASYASVAQMLPAKITQKLVAMSRHYQLTLGTLVQGAWAILLSRYAGENNVLFGSTVAGRPTELEGFESMIGLFINTLPVHVKVREEQTAAEWLTKLQASLVEMRQFEYSSLSEVQSWSEVPNGTPLFQSLVVFENYPVSKALEEGGADVLRMHTFQSFEHTNYPLTLVAFPGDELAMQLIYEESRFASEDVTRLLGHLGTLLQEIALRPAQKIGNLQILPTTERRELLIERNRTEESYPQDHRVHELFQAQALEQPGAVAVLAGDRSVTYGELHALSMQLAEALRNEGVRPGDIVAICMNRSVEMLTGILGILQAGAAYLPMDPAYPQDRLTYMLEEARISVLLTQPGVDADWNSFPGRVLLLGEDWSEKGVGTGASAVNEGTAPVCPEEKTESAGENEATNRAYVIFTSGSTGKPKGVEITHDSLLNLVFWHRRTYEVTPDDRATHLAGVAFDASVWEIWPYLTAGAALYIPDEDTRLNPVQLRDWLLASGITLSFVPTPLAEVLFALEWPGETKLRAVLTGGDRLLQHPPASLPFQLVNHYGPTESTVVATSGVIPPQSAEQAAAGMRPSIGRPIANTRVYVLDRSLRPVPQGVPGELYIGGGGLARGYLYRPELTEERFIESPFAPNERLYRTGDLVKYLPDGSIEYIGRNDDQVHIHGLRIELGEIEAALAAHPSVREAAVLARQDRQDHPGDKRLVAYVVLGHEEQAATLEHADLREYAEGTQSAVGPKTHETSAEAQDGLVSDYAAAHDAAVQAVRHFLQQKLPDYMVPSVFVVLNRLPLTANGKVDRRLLPAPAQDRAGANSIYAAPRSELESKLASIWTSVLGQEQVGIHDNFFELGGDSILSIQVMSRASREGIRLTPQLLFRYPTVAELAQVAELAEQTPSAEQGAVTGKVELTPIQRWFFEQPFKARHYWNQANLLTVSQPVNVEALTEAITALAKQHDALRATFAPSSAGEAGWEQVLRGVNECVPSLTVHSLTQVAEADIAGEIERLADEAQCSLSLEQGPLLKAVLFDLGGGHPARLLLVIHHLAVDAVSWRILLEDLEEGYKQARRGEKIRLQPKTTSYREWAEGLREYANSPKVVHDAEYWLSLDAEALKPLPVELSGPEGNLASTIRTEVAVLSEEETSALLLDVPSVYRTQINDVLLTAFVQAVMAWTGHSSLLIDLEGHGREEITPGLDLSRTVGWFTAIYPVHFVLEPDTDPGQALKAIKEQLRRVPGKGLPYGVLRYLSGDEGLKEKLAALPAPEISFNYLGQFQQSQEGEASVFGTARESYGAVQSTGELRRHTLDVGGFVAEGKLHLTLSYSASLHREETIAGLLAQFKNGLLSLIAHCQLPEAGGFTPSDFPYARLSQTEIDRGFGQGSDIEDVYTLVPAQEGMLFHTIYAPASGVYIQQVSVELKGTFHEKAWEQAWKQTCARHAILRTFFLWEGLAEPHQAVKTHIDIPLHRDDWQVLSREEQEARLKQYLADDRQRGFDVSTAPLMRMALIRRGADSVQFIWTFHHLLLDGWSTPILINEVFALYRSLSQGQTLTLEPSKPYRDYIAWLHRQDTAEAEQFWTRYLEGFTSPTPLPLERPAFVEAKVNTGYRDREFTLSAGLTGKLQALTRRHQVTLNTLIQGAWAILLHRYTGEKDVLFGATVAGRPADLPGSDSIVGLFINTLPVRVPVAPEASVGEWLSGLQERLVELRQYEYSPLVQIQGWSEVPRGTSLFESIVVFENYPDNQAEQEDGESLSIVSSETIDQTNYPLMLVAAPGAELSLRLAYDTSRLEEETVARIAEHLELLLAGISEDSARPISSISLLTEQERKLIFTGAEEANGTVVSVPTVRQIHKRFEEQAARRPSAVAVSFEGQSLTYEELNTRANKLAHYLRNLGVGPEVMVGLSVERTLDLTVAILGILKAGGAYVPLDTVYPSERLRFMAEDARLPIVVAQSHLLGALPELTAKIVCLDTDGPAIDAESAENLSGIGTPDDLAYVIYTSGSTGKPKGVLVTHAHVSRLFDASHAWYGFNEQDVWTLFHSYAFDFSVWELWGALFYGGRLVVVPYVTSRSPEAFYELLHEEKVTVLNQTPSAFRQLIRTEESARQAAELALRYVIFGGEALELPALLPWFERHGDTHPQLVNMYGITETTVHVTYRPLTKHDAESGAGSMIGRPIPDLRVYVLNAQLEHVPVGVAGEMYVAGAGVTRGYLNRPELTAERFIRDPFATDENALLYKTGDVARLLPSGDLEYLGRLDEQVKIRGFRIELGEVEAALSRHAAVREVVVLAKLDDSGEKLLVAYVAGTSEDSLTVTELRSHLSSLLPDYMIPSAFVFLEALPLTGNGKVDVKALPEPDAQRPDLQHSYTAPSGPTEEKLAALWQEVLGIERVGAEDNFFELGGHSLLATRLISRIRDTFSTDVGLHKLFELPTVSMLAMHIDSLMFEGADAALMTELLDELEGFSEEELQQLLLEQAADKEDVDS
ncbi:Linear gramicidin synthase subunit D [compost metagenome]